MDLIHVDMRKWPDRKHWQYRATRLGQDEFGTWLHAPPDTIAKRGDEPPRSLKVGFVALVPNDAWWVVEFYTSHPWHSVYVNIGTPPQWEGDRRFTQVDLDLDVVHLLDGSVTILDEDEFEAHQAELSYPPELIESAKQAASTAAAMLERSEEPFGTAADAWIARVDPAPQKWIR